MHYVASRILQISAIACFALANAPILADAPGPIFSGSWSWSVLGDGIGLAGMHAVDLDADGIDEIVATGGFGVFSGADYWYVLKWRGQSLEQVWTSIRYEEPIHGVAIARAAHEPPIVVVALESSLVLYDGTTFEMVRTLPSVSSDIRDLAVADIDGDGATELVAIDPFDLFVISLEDGTARYRREGLGGLDLDVRQVDGDPALEIAIGNGSALARVLDGATLESQWEGSVGTVSSLRLAVISGRPSVVLGRFSFKGILALDLESGVVVWQVPGFSVNAISVGDVDGMAGDEVLFGGTGWGDLHVLDGATGKELWQLDDPSAGVSKVTSAIGPGGELRIVWGVGFSSTQSDHLLVADAVARKIIWRGEDLRGPLLGFAVVRDHPSGTPRLLTGSFSSESAYRGGRPLEFDPRTHQLLRIGDAVSEVVGQYLWRIRTGNLDLDPQDEFCVATSGGSGGFVSCFDSRTLDEQWRFEPPYGLSVHSLSVADVDRDGSPEIVFGASRGSYLVSGSYVYCLDGRSGDQKWRSEDLGGSSSDLLLLRVGQVDSDPDVEIIIGDYETRVFVLSGATGFIEEGPWSLPVTALEIADFRAGPAEDVLVGLADGSVGVLDTSSGGLRWLVAQLAAPATAIAAMGRISGQRPNLAIAADGRLTVLSATGRTLWESGDLSPNSGSVDSILASDLDGDDRSDLVIGTGHGFTVFSTRSIELVFADGFESFDLSRWSESHDNYSSIP